MNKTLIFLAIFIVYTSLVYTQVAPSRISGKIYDAETNEPIPAVTIRILAQNDSTLITGDTSARDGSFSIPVSIGKYIAQFSFMGYSNNFLDIELTKENPSLRLDSIKLNESSFLLDEAVITAQSLEIVVRGDTLEYNASAYNVAEMAVVEDLLKQMPGVEIDASGTIKVQGKEIKRIFVDGKEFFSDDPKVASKNLPAKMIDKLQVLDKKTETELTTGFDDGEEEMIINLTVKPNMKRGTFGNIAGGYGSNDRYEANALINHMRNEDQYTFIGGINNTNNAGGGRSGRGGGGGVSTSRNGGVNFNKQFSKELQLGGNTNYSSGKNYITSKTYTQNYLKQGDTFEEETSTTNSLYDNISLGFNMEWRPDSLTSIIFRPNISRSTNESENIGEFSTMRESGDTINYGNSHNISSGNSNNWNGDIEINRRFKKRGRSMSIRLRADGNTSNSLASNLSNTYYNGSREDDLLDQRITDTNKSSGFNGSASYVEPIGESYFLQFSYNYRTNSSISDKDTRTQDENGDYVILDKLYSRLNENESTNQNFGINLRTRKEKYDYTIGFSVYPSSSNRTTYIGDSLISDITQNVTNYSPTGHFNYRWSRQQNLRINYNGSTNQPSVNQISPVVDVSNPLNITYGNPNLNPSFNHRVNLRYQHSIPEHNRFYMVNGNFNYTSNAIVSSRFTDPETGRRENTYMNVDGNWNGSMQFTTTQPLKNKKFSISTTTNANYGVNNGFSNNEENINRQLNLSENLSLNYISDKVVFSIRGNVSYNKVKNSLEGQEDREYMNYGTSATSTIYLPYDINIQSDIRYSTNSGYADGFKQNEALWNASIEKQVLKQKNGIVRIRVFDILQQRSNINRSVTSNYIRDTTTNTLTSYFIASFVYRFNAFSGGGSSQDMNRRGSSRGRGPDNRTRF